MTTIKVGSYVTDTSDSSNYCRSVYQVTGLSFDRAIVRRVGHIVQGNRLDTRGDHGVTHRLASNLREWN